MRARQRGSTTELLKLMLGPAGCGAQGWCDNEGADNVLHGTNSWRDNKNEWVWFRKETTREHRHFFGGGWNY